MDLALPLSFVSQWRPHNNSRESEAGMSDDRDLLTRLRAVEPEDGKNSVTRWYRNPDGPEAADEIIRLQVELELARRTIELQKVILHGWETEFRGGE